MSSCSGVPFPDGVVLVDPDYLKDRKGTGRGEVGAAEEDGAPERGRRRQWEWDSGRFRAAQEGAAAARCWGAGEGGVLTAPPGPPSPVFVTLTCAFRYGREDLDVLGLSFRKDLFIATYQAFPPMPNPPRPPTRLQDRLLRKLGQHAHPFFFTVRTPLTLCGARGLGLRGGEGVARCLSGADLEEGWEGEQTHLPHSACLQEALVSVSSQGPLPSYFLTPRPPPASELRLGERFGGSLGELKPPLSSAADPPEPALLRHAAAGPRGHGEGTAGKALRAPGTEQGPVGAWGTPERGAVREKRGGNRPQWKYGVWGRVTAHV